MWVLLGQSRRLPIGLVGVCEGRWCGSYWVADFVAKFGLYFRRLNSVNSRRNYVGRDEFCKDSLPFMALV